MGLTTADEIEHRATSALGGYVAMLRVNLRDALALARQVESVADRCGLTRLRVVTSPAATQPETCPDQSRFNPE
ncbi:MAG: hypothetical protein BWK72_14580 [Rhodoferax ferrireducens]|uniref:Uncharacterized protein n=1 Tax=Rhodoferax ferrireducens TaxID=192843 RepID=A0A1W9KS50_9BURK|nr:MAG: hypothetical protein BWK72_14580 [Rhodoferax ferrireducens]